MKLNKITVCIYIENINKRKHDNIGFKYTGSNQ